METLTKLELSYIGREDDYKDIFLDVACILKYDRKEDAIRKLESCGYHARIGLRVLEQRSLIIIDDIGWLVMHDHIEEMARNIVRRSHPKEPSKHSRLWVREEIEHVLLNSLGTEATKCIDMPMMRLSPVVVGQGLRNMKELRILLLDYDTDDNSVNVGINQVSQYLPNELRYLSWMHYPYWSLPNAFEANNLVGLRLYDSRIIQLWEGGERKILYNLGFLDLHKSKLRTLDLGPTPNLQRLNLEDCQDLIEVHKPVGCLTRLVYLNLCGCSRLKSLLFLKELESLEVLNLKRLDLREFPDIIVEHGNNSLLELDFSCNGIEELPSSIGNFHKLVSLDLYYCKYLKHVYKI